MTDVSDAELLERFVTSRDESAFAALMVRHGPMVFGVCRRLLHHTQDAEDAFQATFLILVRKAAGIGKRELLGNWLYGVALRVARRARDMAAKRRVREMTDMERIAETTRELAEATDVSAAITEEVQRLPAKYRIPVVLCYLEGRSNEEAAGEIRCPVGTVKTRLSRAREMLRKRLVRRGLVLSTAAFSAALSVEVLAAPLSPALLDSALKAALDFAAGDAAAPGLVSVQAAELTKGVLHTMFVTKMKVLASLVLTLAMFVGGAGGFAYHRLATDADAKKTDNESVQGIWKVVSAKSDGKELEAGSPFLKQEWLISRDRIVISNAGKTVHDAAYKIDPTAKQKTLDLVEGDKTMLALYKLEGDTLTICLAHPVPEQEVERPSSFESKEGSHVVLMVLNRAK